MELFIEKILFGMQVAMFETSGKGISTDYSAMNDIVHINTLTTCVNYMAQHAEIAKLVASLMQLIEKDAEDLKQLQSAIEQMDSELSTGIQAERNGG